MRMGPMMRQFLTVGRFRTVATIVNKTSNSLIQVCEHMHFISTTQQRKHHGTINGPLEAQQVMPQATQRLAQNTMTASTLKHGIRNKSPSKMGFVQNYLHRFLRSWKFFLSVFFWMVVFAVLKGIFSNNSLRQQQRIFDQGDVNNHVALNSLPMETKEIVSGVSMPVLSIGTGGLERKEAKTIVETWLSLGGTGIDTALGYKNHHKIAAARDGFNQTETGGGKLCRSDLFLTTKIPDCDTAAIAENIETSLAQMKTDYIDLMLIHSPKRGDCAKAWTILEDYHRSSKLRAIGVSNFRKKDLEPLIERGTVVPCVNQIKLNIERYNKKIIPTIEYASKHGITIEASSPLGRGSGEVVDLPLVRNIAKKHGVTEYQVAIKWILQHGWMAAFQSTSKEHQGTNADVFGWELAEDEMDQLDAVGGELFSG